MTCPFRMQTVSLDAVKPTDDLDPDGDDITDNDFKAF